jgi:NADH-quinone oxidoreductase subunit N
MITDFFIQFRSETALTALILLLLFLKITREVKNESLLQWMQLLLCGVLLLIASGPLEGHLFGSMFTATPLITLEKLILTTGFLLICMLHHEWLKAHEHLIEFLILSLSSLLGMFLFVSSGHLMLLYLSVELITIPIAAMVNFDLEKRRSSEAAMKMILSSAFASGVLLFGISLIYGTTGTLQLHELPAALQLQPLQIAAFLLLISAFAFKLSAVPFHLWTADVYEGAPIAVAAFLSVLSKGAVTFMLITLLYKVFYPLEEVGYLLLQILSILTVLIGNLFALRQKNFKRFLAFSSIAQIGFILAALSSFTIQGAAASVYFIIVYLFSNLAAFGIISIVSSHNGKEDLEHYRGFYKNNKFLSWVLALSLFSLAGIPPTAGFFGKYFLLIAASAREQFVFVTILALNLMLSLYYYLNIIRLIFSKSTQEMELVRISPPAKLALWICSAGILLLGFAGNLLAHIQSIIN